MDKNTIVLALRLLLFMAFQVMHTDLIRQFRALTPEEQVKIVYDIRITLIAMVKEIDRVSSLNASSLNKWPLQQRPWRWDGPPAN